jgi:hypothetical protein
MKGARDNIPIKLTKVEASPVVRTDPAERVDLPIDIRKYDLIAVEVGEKHGSGGHFL